MKSASIFPLLLITLIALSACKGAKTSAQSSGGSPIGSGGGCLIGRWPNNALPLNVKMSSEFTADYTNADLVAGLNPLEQMAKVWNIPVAGTRTLITTPFAAAGATGFASTSSFRDSEIGIYKSHTWFTNVSSSALAITQFFGIVSTDATLGDYIKLTHADIIMNYRDYGARFTMLNNPTFEFDVPTVVLHEIGHLLGLCHEITASSIMAPYYLTDQRSLQTFDSTIIQDLYVSANIASMSAMKNARSATIDAAPGTEVSGIIELRSDGECIHKINGKETYKHKVKL